jgi:hypothetical protein
LSKGKVAIVDDDLFPIISKVHWYCHGRDPLFYAVRNITVATKTQTTSYMHHLVAGFPLKKGFVVDHINRNSLDNRRANLRIVEQKINGRNRKDNFENFGRSKAGVVRKAGKWQAQYCSNGRHIYLGIYGTQEEAHNAYLKVANSLREGENLK